MAKDTKKEIRRGKELSAHELRALAVEACVDPRTAQKWLTGQKVQSTVTSALVRAYEKLHR